MVEKVKSISTYNIANGQGSWSDPVPLGADIENIDITESSNVNSGNNETLDTVASIQDSDLVVGTPDTGANAWSKFNKLKKRLGNVLEWIENKINGLNNVVWTFDKDWFYGNYRVGTGNVIVDFPCPPLATTATLSLERLRLFIPNNSSSDPKDQDSVRYHTIDKNRISLTQPKAGAVQLIIPVRSIYGEPSSQLTAIASTPGQFPVIISGTITFS